jgi:hypothetical protein
MIVVLGEAKTYTSDVDYWVSKNIGIIKMGIKESATELVTYTQKLIVASESYYQKYFRYFYIYKLI